MTALTAPQLSPVRKPLGAVLKAVPASKNQRTVAPFVVLLSTVLIAGMYGLLMLSTTLEQQARQIETLQSQHVALENEEAKLLHQATEMRSPRVLALRAAGLGMVPNPRPVYITLKDGAIIGKPVPVSGKELPSMTGGLR